MKPSHGHHVPQVGDVFYMMFTACKYGGGYYRQGSVFCAADIDRAFQAFPAPDNKLVQILPLKKSLYILTVLRNKKEGIQGGKSFAGYIYAWRDSRLSRDRDFMLYFYMRDVHYLSG